MAVLFFIFQEESKKASDLEKKKVTKRKPSSDKLSKEGESAPVAPAEASTTVASKGGDEGEFTVKIPLKDESQQPVVPGEASSVITKDSDEGEFTVKIPSGQKDDGDSKKKKVTKRKPSSDKREDSVSSEASSVVQTSQEQPELTAKISLKKSDDGSQAPAPGNIFANMKSSSSPHLLS